MDVIAFVIAIAAVVVALLAAFGAATRTNLTALAIALLGVAWIVELVRRGAEVHT